jgi:hypothetical protein
MEISSCGFLDPRQRVISPMRVVAFSWSGSDRTRPIAFKSRASPNRLPERSIASKHRRWVTSYIAKTSTSP